MRKAGGARQNSLPLYGLNSFQIPGANISDAHDACLWPSLQSERILDRIAARGTANQPFGGSQRAAGEVEAVAGTMRDFDALALGCKQHRMLADNVASAHDRKADAARPARAAFTVSIVDRTGAQGRAARAGHRLPETQGRAGGGIALHAVMRFEDFDVVAWPERLRRERRQFG